MQNLTLKRVKEKFSDSIQGVIEFRGELTVVIEKESLLALCSFLKDDPDLQYDFLSDVTAVDYPEREKRFDVVYNLYSIPKRWRIRLKVTVGEEESVPSITSLWDSANWPEREVFDLFGIRFDNHPDLTRIVMPDDWVGHPLRKDFPLTQEEVTFSHNKNRPPKMVE